MVFGLDMECDGLDMECDGLDMECDGLWSCYGVGARGV